MKATILLMAIKIKNNEYSIERVPSVLLVQVEEQIAKLERDEQQNG